MIPRSSIHVTYACDAFPAAYACSASHKSDDVFLANYQGPIWCQYGSAPCCAIPINEIGQRYVGLPARERNVTVKTGS